MPAQNVSAFPLVFGNSQASISNSFKHFAEGASRLFELEEVGVAKSAETGFQGKLSFVSINSVTASAYSSTALKYIGKGLDDYFVDIKARGSASVTTKNRSLSYGEGQVALFAPFQPTFVDASLHSSAIFKISGSRLQETIDAINPESRAESLENITEKAPLVAPINGKVSPLQLFRAVFSLVDECQSNPDILGRLNVDDIIYRTIAFALFPQLFIKDDELSLRKVNRSAKIVDKICDLIKQNPSRWISKSEMESTTNVTGRAIQLAFQKRYGVSPMDWQRQEKLRRARDVFLRSNKFEKISSLAYDLGFTSPTKFSAYYKQLFGELPRETIKKRNAQVE